ncbi:hypothetical protein O3P69_018599 [Scylla paramamosain]|uniref:Uncharacterized protein n=1 Tax=Scylla paramamosain TaxID=85552 RepID=A0AAW0T227_SCYPA
MNTRPSRFQHPWDAADKKTGSVGISRRPHLQADTHTPRTQRTHTCHARKVKVSTSRLATIRPSCHPAILPYHDSMTILSEPPPIISLHATLDSQSQAREFSRGGGGERSTQKALAQMLRNMQTATPSPSQVAEFTPIPSHSRLLQVHTWLFNLHKAPP